MIRNTIMGICSERMQIVWGEWQETLLDWTRSSIERKIVTRAAGIGAEERDSVGEGGHRILRGGRMMTDFLKRRHGTLAQVLTCWRNARSHCRCNGKLSPAKAASLTTPPLLSQFPYYSFQKEKKDLLRKCHFLPVCVLSFTSSLKAVLPDVKPHAKRWDYQGDFQISGVGASGEAVSVVLFRLTHQNDLPMTLAAGVWDARQHLLLVTHAFWSICSYLASVLHCTVPFNGIR